MNWTTSYQQRMATPQEAMSVVQSGQRVYIGGGCAVPQSLLDALVARAPELHDVETVSILTMGSASYVAMEMLGHIRHNALFVGHNVRSAVNAGRADFTPVFLYEIPGLFRDGILPIDVCLIQVGPPDEHGFCSLGVEVGVTKPAAQAARIVIAEVNDRMPRVLGDSFIHASKLDYIVPVSRALIEFPQGESGGVQDQIAHHITDLIEDGSTLQAGIGGIPDAVLGCLRTHKDLGLHSEILSDGVMGLVEAGVITNEKKNSTSGQVRCRLYAWHAEALRLGRQ